VSDSIQTNMKAVVDLEVRILFVVLRNARFVYSWTKTLAFSVLVNAPHVVNSIVDRLVVAIA